MPPILPSWLSSFPTPAVAEAMPLDILSLSDSSATSLAVSAIAISGAPMCSVSEPLHAQVLSALLCRIRRPTPRSARSWRRQRATVKSLRCRPSGNSWSRMASMASGASSMRPSALMSKSVGGGAVGVPGDDLEARWSKGSSTIGPYISSAASPTTEATSTRARMVSRMFWRDRGRGLPLASTSDQDSMPCRT